MNSKSSTPSLAMAASSMVAALSGPALSAPRALLVTLGKDGALMQQPVGIGQSLLRIETELFDYLNSKPFATEWIAMLRDYCTGRLEAEAAASASGGFVTAPEAGVWHLNHVPAFQQVTVGGAQ